MPGTSSFSIFRLKCHASLLPAAEELQELVAVVAFLLLETASLLDVEDAPLLAKHDEDGIAEVRRVA